MRIGMTQGRDIKKWLICILIYYLIYVFLLLFKLDFWSDILSPGTAVISACIILQAYWQTDRSKKYLSMIFALMAMLFWAAADILWVVDVHMLHVNPTEDVIANLLYNGTNLFLCVAVVFYTIQKIKKWNAIQLLIDIVFISAACIYLLWIFIFDKDLQKITELVQYDWLAAVSLTLDIAIVIGIEVWFLSIQSKHTHLFFKVLACSFCAYAIADIFYYYAYVNGTYISNTLNDALYAASLLGLGAGYLMFPRRGSSQEEILSINYANVLNKHRWWMILPAPLLVFIIDGFTMDVIYLLGVFVVQEMLSGLVQLAIKKERLFQLEKEMNGALEMKIAERTCELMEKNLQLDYLSNKDIVTDLYNRRHFFQTLEETIVAIKPDEMIALLLLDIDRFKIINDSYGHNTGDLILLVLSRRMQKNIGKHFYLARLGGDEFVVLIHLKDIDKDIAEYANELIADCTQNIMVGDYTFQITLSAGIAVYPKDAHNVETLVKNADIAMYQAKKIGFNKAVLFSDTIMHAVRREHGIELRLKKIVYDTEFQLYFQPLFTIEKCELIGMEALLRWKTPDNGFIPPDEFIPIAEKLDIIVPIGNWVIEKAFRQIAKWNETYGRALKMGINVSPKQLDQTDFMQNLKDALIKFAVLPEWIDVEITEGIAVKGDSKISGISEQFKEEGITISIDDFGTGYASFSCWKLLHFDRVKIAKPLIDSITFEEYDKQIVKSITMLADSLGIDTIAEGVETKEQFLALKEAGCKQVQGYLLGKPMPPEEFEEKYLQKNASDTSASIAQPEEVFCTADTIRI